METITINLEKLNHSDIKVCFGDGIPVDDVNWLVAIIEKAIHDGSQYKNMELIEIGTLLLRIEQNKDCLWLHEPDFQNMPISWVLGVTRSLRLLRTQKDIVESVALPKESDFTSLMSSLIIGKDLDLSRNCFVMERVEPSKNDSGWFIGNLYTNLNMNDQSSLQRRSVYEIMISFSQLSCFLALPSESKVEISEHGTNIFYKNKLLNIIEGSFLDQRQF